MTNQIFHHVEHVRVFDIRRLPSGQWQAVEEPESNERWRKALEEDATRPISSEWATEALEEAKKDLEWRDIDCLLRLPAEIVQRLELAYQLYVHHRDPTVNFPHEIEVMTAVDRLAAMKSVSVGRPNDRSRVG